MMMRLWGGPRRQVSAGSTESTAPPQNGFSLAGNVRIDQSLVPTLPMSCRVVLLAFEDEIRRRMDRARTEVDAGDLSISALDADLGVA